MKGTNRKLEFGDSGRLSPTRPRVSSALRTRLDTIDLDAGDYGRKRYK